MARKDMVLFREKVWAREIRNTGEIVEDYFVCGFLNTFKFGTFSIFEFTINQ